MWWWGSSNAGALGSTDNIFSLPSLPGSLWPWVIEPDRVLSMGQAELNWVLILKWIVWNRNVFLDLSLGITKSAGAVEI